MKKIVWILFIGLAGSVYAQKIELKGTVREAGNNEPFAFANIVLQTVDSAFVAGTTTNNEGKFAIANITPGDYRLVAVCIGYKTQYIALNGLSESITVPDILMAEETIELGAVTVSGSAITNRIDRKLIFPTEQQINASGNGVDLLQQLMLPRLQINPLTRTVGLVGEGEVQLRINGVKVEIADVVALQPKDVIRVEYHDNPGLRYGNAEVVIDYIVRRHESGGNLGVDISNSFKLKRFGYNNIHGRINHKKSEFALNYFIYLRDMYQTWRDNEETFSLADGTVLHRKEEGDPAGRWQMNQQYLTATYSYMNDKRLLNATLRYFGDNLPHSLEYRGKLYNVDNPDNYMQMSDWTKEKGRRSALDLYWQENLNNDQTLVLNLVGTYNHTNNNRGYTESRDGVVVTDIDNLVVGSKYSWIGEGIYEKKFGVNNLSAGVRHTQAYADNIYKNGHEYNTKMQQGETLMYAEWKGKVKKLDYTLGTGFTRSSFRQEAEGIDHSDWTFNPRLALFYPLPSGNSSFRLTSRTHYVTPSLSQLSAVEQIIDSLQIRRGNSNLTPYYRYENTLTYEWKKGMVYISLQGKYQYQPSPVMEEKFHDGGKIVQSWTNQKSWQHLNTSAHLRIGPVKDIVTLTLYGGLNHYISHGNTYRHVYNNPFLSVTLTANYKKFQAIFEGNILTSDVLDGETMYGGERIHIFFIGYKHKNANFGIGAFNLFFSDFRRDTENYSKYASFKRSLYINDFSRMFTFRFSYNINFGRSFQSGQKRLNNADENTGVMKTGK